MDFSAISNLLVNYWAVLLICPALFLFIFSNELNIIGLNALVYRKQCLASFNTTICNNINSYPNASVVVQELSSEKQMELNIAFIIPALFAVVHFSGMADRRLNYQMPLLVSVVGSVINTLFLIFATDLETKSCYTLMFLAQVINGLLGGGSLCFISSCFSHISIYEEKVDENAGGDRPDRSKYRSIRFSFCEFSLLIGNFLGSLVSGYSIGNKTELFGFKKTFIVSFSIYLFVFIYVLCMFRYLKWFKASQNNQMVEQKIYDDIQAANRVQTFRVSCEAIFTNEISFFKDTAKLLLKKRENNARFHINSLLLVYFIGASVSLGLNPIQYLYLVKNKAIQLSQINYGFFKAFNTLTRAVSLLVILPLLKYYNMPDYWFYLIGITSEFLNLIAFILAASYSYLIWIAPVVYMFSNYFVVCIRIFASKLVEPNETGKFFGIIAIVEFLVLLVSSSVITVVYKASLAFFPALIYIICAVICAFLCYPFLIVIIRDLHKLNQVPKMVGIKNVLVEIDSGHDNNIQAESESNSKQAPVLL